MLPRMADAMVLRRPGEFVLESYPVPEPGDDEFILRVELTTICGGDLIEYLGGNRKAEYPLLMGHEVVGTVDSIGSSAARIHGVQEGERVIVEPYLRCGRCPACVRGQYHFCAEGATYGVTIPSTRPPHLWGGYAQYLFGAPSARVHRIGPDIDRRAAALTSVIGNGVRWIRSRGELRAGEGVIITGLGVQALASIVLASIAGASPIVVACREEDPARLALAREYGADVIVNSTRLEEDPDARADLRRLGIALAIECTGAEGPYAVAVDALAPQGRLVAAGTRGGRPLSIDLDAVVFKEIDIRGGLGQSNDTEYAAELVNAHAVAFEKMVTRVFPLGRTAEAMELCLQGHEDIVHIGLDPWET